MLPPNNHNGRFVRILLLVLICDLHQRDVDPRIAFSDAREFDEWKWGGLSHGLDLSEVWLHLRVCVWNCIGHVNLIRLIIKFEVKAACVIGFWFVDIHLVNFNVVRRDVVVDIEAAVVPALTIRVVAFDGPKRRLHSIIEQRVTLGKIDNIYSYHVCEVFRIYHTKVKPLQIAWAICVISNPDIVFYGWSLAHLINVTTFKLAIKEHVVRFVLRLGALLATHYAWTTKV